MGAYYQKFDGVSGRGEKSKSPPVAVCVKTQGGGGKASTLVRVRAYGSRLEGELKKHTPSLEVWWWSEESSIEIKK